MRRFYLSSLVALGLLMGAGSVGSQAFAQDDWGVRRDPFDKGLIGRYKRMLAGRPSDAKALGKLMAMYRRYRSIGLLVREYQGAQGKHPSFSNLMVLAYLQRHQGNTDEALARFTEAAAQKPGNATVHAELGKMLRARGKAAQAVSHYEKALSLASGKKQKMASLRILADLAMDTGNITSAKAYLEKFLQLDPNNSQTLIELGEALAQHKRYDEAIEIFRKTETKLRADPIMRVELVTRIGQALEGKGEDLAAVAEYERGMQFGGRGYYTTKELIARIVAIYRQRQELATLVGKLEKRWKPKRRSYFEWDTLARLYEETGEADKAIEAYRKAIKKTPYELDTQRRLISLLENSGREDEALKQYERVIQVAPGEPRFQLELAKRYWRQGKTKQALAMTKKIQTRFARDAGVIASLADLYTAWNRSKEALAAYQVLARIEPGDSRHLENLGEQHFQDGDKAKAEKVWKKILRVKNAQNYARLAGIYAEHDMLADAIAMYSKAIELEAKVAKHYKGRANVFERLRQIGESITDWEKVLALSPDKKSYASARQEARRRVVNLLARTRRGRRPRRPPLHGRIATWELGFHASPPSLGDGFYLIEAYRRTGQDNNLKRTLEELLKLRPGDQGLMVQLVKSYRTGQQHDLAVTLLLELARLNPGRERDFYNQIAEIKTDLQQDDEAIEYVRRALEKSPNDPIAYQRLAERYEAMQKQGKAIEAYEKVLELSPRSFSVSFVLARLYINQGERQKATELYRQVLTKASKPEILSRAGREAVELEWLGGSLKGLLRTVSPLVASQAHKPVYRRILVQIYDRYVPQLAAKLEHANVKERNAARQELNKLGASGLRPLLEALADQSDPQQQRTAVSVLGYLGNTAAAAPLVRMAKREPATTNSRLHGPLDWSARVSALIAAARLGDPRTIPTLLALANHNELSMREVAVFALGVTSDPKTLPALMKASEDQRHSMQTLACLAFSELKGKESIRNSTERAIEMLADNKLHDHTRAACAWLIGYRRATRGQDALLRALSRGNDQTQRLAAWSLGEIGKESAALALVSAYASKREPVRSSAANALEKLLGKPPTRARDTTAVRHAIFPIASKRFDEARTIASLASEKNSTAFDVSLLIGQHKNLAFGLRAAITQHRDLVLRALIDLDQWDEGISFGLLSAGHKKLTPARRKALAKTLRSVGTILLPDLTLLAQHRDPEVRSRSLSIVSKTGGIVARDLLIAGLSDSNLGVRKTAMRAAARLATAAPASADALAAVITSRLEKAPHWQERAAAAAALARWPVQRRPRLHQDALIKALATDEKGFVRAAAATSLGSRLRPKTKASTPAIAALANAANHKTEPLSIVRLQAVRALQKLGGAEAQRVLASVATSDPSKRVREAASQI